MIARLSPTVSLFVYLLSSVVDATNTFTWSPSISLTSDLDEPQQLGFCLDIFGFRDGISCSSPMQAHSCKTSGADTQFEYYARTKSIRAVNYDENCDMITTQGVDTTSSISSKRACVFADGMAIGSTLALTKCDQKEANQNFEAKKTSGDSDNVDSYELHLRDTNLCVVVADNTRQAGRYVARDLFLGDCASVPVELKTWTISPIPEKGNSGSSGTTNTHPSADEDEPAKIEEQQENDETQEEYKNDHGGSTKDDNSKAYTAMAALYSYAFLRLWFFSAMIIIS